MMLKNLAPRLFIALLALALSLFAARLGLLEAPRDFAQDVWHRLAGQRYEPSRVVIVSLDDKSLQMFRHDPLAFWGPHFAKALSNLRALGIKAAGLDFLYSVSVESWLGRNTPAASQISRTYDAPFRAELASGQVVLAGFLSGQGSEASVLLPIEDYLFALPQAVEDIGLTNLLSDPDGVIRRFVPAIADSDGYAWPSFASQIARKSGSEPSEDNQLEPRGISFAGPPGTFTRVAMSRLLADGAGSDPDLAWLKDKSVVISLENSGMQDLHLTPYARSLPWQISRLMSGPEVQANILETILGAPVLKPLGPSGEGLAALAAAIFGAVVFFRCSAWKGLLWLGVWLVVCAAASFICFVFWLGYDPGQAQLTGFVCYLGAIGSRLGREERKRAKLRQIFGRYVSPQVVDALAAGEDLPDLGGDVCGVTVLFSDIRNFTTISEKLTPKEVVEMLNEYFSQACQPILEQGGMVDKFIGDAIMAVFGAPKHYPDHALRAAKAALQLVDTAVKFRGYMENRFGGRDLPQFAVGVGLHTGEAVVGNIGSPQRLDFTAIGDTVNTASRLEGQCKELKWSIVASRAVIEACAGLVSTRGEDLRQVKGRAEAVKVYEIVGLTHAEDENGHQA